MLSQLAIVSMLPLLLSLLLQRMPQQHYCSALATFRQLTRLLTLMFCATIIITAAAATTAHAQVAAKREPEADAAADHH
jgi:hypothetical protein